MVDGHAKETFNASSGYETQKGADNAALKGCRTAATDAGIGKLAKNCKVVTRPKKPGYGAVVCGDSGCSWGTSYSAKQEAINATYSVCAQNYKNCNSTGISTWEDFVGFSQSKAKRRALSGDELYQLFQAGKLPCENTQFQYRRWRSASGSSMSAQLMGGSGARSDQDARWPDFVGSMQTCAKQMGYM